MDNFQLIGYSLRTGEAKPLGFYGDIDSALFSAEKLECKAIATAILDCHGEIIRSTEYSRSVSDNSRKYFADSQKWVTRIMGAAVQLTPVKAKPTFKNFRMGFQCSEVKHYA
jgi:hypothetical protein